MKKTFVVLAILLVAAFLRFYKISVSPGYEWDEPVYAQIAERTALLGYPNNGNISSPVPYLYHPPFDFYLKGTWFTLLGTTGSIQDIAAGRILSTIESLIGLLIAYFCLLEFSGKKGAFIGLLLLATDGWLIYTSRLNLIENAMMPLGMFGIWMYMKATKSEKTVYYLLAGLFLAFAAVYKHTGIPFLLVPIINFGITRKDWRNHKFLIYTMEGIVLIFMAVMWLIWKDNYISQTWVQIERTIGALGSRGLNYNMETVITAIVQTYWVFAATVAAIIVVGLTILFRLIKIFRHGELYNSILFSWAIAAFVFLAAIALKAPHYLITALIPGYMFIAAEFGRVSEGGRFKQIAIYSIVGLALVANLYTWNARFFKTYDNALLETFNYFQTVPVTAHVIDDDCVGTGISQVSYNLDLHSSDQGIKEASPDYVVMYSTITEKAPKSQALEDLLLRSKVVKQFTGFKELIEIYKVDP